MGACCKPARNNQDDGNDDAASSNTSAQRQTAILEATCGRADKLAILIYQQVHQLRHYHQMSEIEHKQTPKLLDALNDLWEVFDADGNGTISPSEFSHIFGEMNVRDMILEEQVLSTGGVGAIQKHGCCGCWRVCSSKEHSTSADHVDLFVHSGMDDDDSFTRSQWDAMFAGVDMAHKRSVQNAEFLYQKMREAVDRVVVRHVDEKLLGLLTMLGVSETFASAALRETAGLKNPLAKAMEWLRNSSDLTGLCGPMKFLAKAHLGKHPGDSWFQPKLDIDKSKQMRCESRTSALLQSEANGELAIPLPLLPQQTGPTSLTIDAGAVVPPGWDRDAHDHPNVTCSNWKFELKFESPEELEALQWVGSDYSTAINALTPAASKSGYLWILQGGKTYKRSVQLSATKISLLIPANDRKTDTPIGDVICPDLLEFEVMDQPHEGYDGWVLSTVYKRRYDLHHPDKEVLQEWADAVVQRQAKLCNTVLSRGLSHSSVSKTATEASVFARCVFESLEIYAESIGQRFMSGTYIIHDFLGTTPHGLFFRLCRDPAAYNRISSHLHGWCPMQPDQWGIDFDQEVKISIKDPEDVSKSYETTKRTVLFCQININREPFLMFKPEEHGTRSFGATLAHGVDFMRGRGLVTAVLGETIPKQFCRKERIPEAAVELFVERATKLGISKTAQKKLSKIGCFAMIDALEASPSEDGPKAAEEMRELLQSMIQKKSSNTVTQNLEYECDPAMQYRIGEEVFVSKNAVQNVVKSAEQACIELRERNLK